MCGRAYETYSEEELWARYVTDQSKRHPLRLRPNYNLSPTQLAPVVLVRDGDRTIEIFRWGLVPFWAKDVKEASKYSLINAKGEEITDKRSYKVPFMKRRCIVPLTGFYEWQRMPEGPKRPFAIHLANGDIMSVAGVWESWTSPDKSEQVNSFSIITTSANEAIAPIHNRMPVILEKASETEWLNPDNDDVESLKELLRPCPSEALSAYEVSTKVNSPANNTEEILLPKHVE